MSDRKPRAKPWTARYLNVNVTHTDGRRGFTLRCWSQDKPMTSGRFVQVLTPDGLINVWPLEKLQEWQRERHQ